MNIKTIATTLATAASLLVAACGGGGDSAADDSAAGGAVVGATATAMSYGTVTQFGSVWVNGVEFHTGSSSFRVDDNPGVESDLRIGMVVRVDGSIADKTASMVTVDDAIKGRVEQVLDANRMRVMGQTVQIDSQTRFDNGVVPVVGDIVEVHGQAVSDGTVAAGFIEKKSTFGAPPYAAKGFVMNHNTAAQTFALGSLVVSYAGATVNDMPAGSWNGRLVEAKGSACAGNPVCGTLTASQVEPSGVRMASIAIAEVEGFVTSTSANGFVVGGQSVVTNAATVFAGGVLADISAGTKLEVEGSISAGVLTAKKVSFRDNIRLEGDVASVDAASGSLTLAGLPGVTVNVNSLTGFKGVASLAGLAAPNHLRIRARLAAGNTVLATELEMRSSSPDARLVLQAPVSAVSGTSSVTMLSNVVDTSGVSDNEFKDINDLAIDRTAFYAAVKVGTMVKARGDLGVARIDWHQVELED